MRPDDTISLNNQPCPICAHTRSKLLWSTTWPEHRYPGEFSMRRCDSCGLLFNSPRLNDEQLGLLYGRNYYFFNRPDAREMSRIIPMYQRTVGIIANQLTQRRMLDIGCGRGYFPAVLKRLGWEAQAVELSASAAAYARSRFDIDVFCGTIEQFASSSQMKQFPLVSAIDVIEHVPSPRSFVEGIVKVTAPGGVIVIDTPNADAHNIQTQQIEWAGFNPFHIFLFTIENLTKLLGAYGLVVQRSFSYNNTPHALSARDVVVRSLKRFGLLGPAARMYFELNAITTRSRSPIEPHIASAVEQIRSQISWDQTTDASGELAAATRGDNIVVIARRS